MDETISTYNHAQSPEWAEICHRLASIIDNELPEAECKVWHGGPVWFLKGNPIVGYWVRKGRVQLLFWSGQSFDEPGLKSEGKFKAAEVSYTRLEEIDHSALQRWLATSRHIQWDYKNIVKRRGRLERIES